MKRVGVALVVLALIFLTLFGSFALLGAGGTVFQLGALVGFPSLILGLAFLFFSRFSPQLVKFLTGVVSSISRFYGAAGVFPARSKFLSWLAWHELSPSSA